MEPSAIRRLLHFVGRAVPPSLAAAALATGLLCAMGGRWWFGDLWCHFRPQWLLLVLVACFVCAASRRFLALVLALVAVPFQAAPVIGRALQDEVPPRSADDSPGFRALTLNLLKENADAAAVAALLRAEDPDVAVFQESTHAWQAQLRALSWPHQHHAGGKGVFGMSILSKWPILSADFVNTTDPGDGRFAVRAVVLIRGREVTIVDCHLSHPTSAEKVRRVWREHAALLAVATSERHTAKRPVLLLGDFNAAPWSHLWQDFAADLQDSSRGRGWEATRHVWWPDRLLIDHAFLSGDGVRFTARRIGPAVGSDHRPVTVEIAFPHDDPD